MESAFNNSKSAIPCTADVIKFQSLMSLHNAPFEFLKVPYTFNNKKGFKCQLHVLGNPMHAVTFIEHDAIVECILSRVGLDFFESSKGRAWLLNRLKEYQSNPAIAGQSSISPNGPLSPYYSEPQVYAKWKSENICTESSNGKNAISLLNEFCQRSRCELILTEIVLPAGFVCKAIIKQRNLECTSDCKANKKDSKLDACEKMLDLIKFATVPKQAATPGSDNKSADTSPIKRYQPSLTRQTRQIAKPIEEVKPVPTVECNKSNPASNVIFSLLDDSCKLLNLERVLYKSVHLGKNIKVYATVLGLTVSANLSNYNLAKTRAAELLLERLAEINPLFQLVCKSVENQFSFKFHGNSLILNDISFKSNLTKRCFAVLHLATMALDHLDANTMPEDVEMPLLLSSIIEFSQVGITQSNTKYFIHLQGHGSYEYSITKHNMCTLTFEFENQNHIFESPTMQSLYAAVEFVSTQALSILLAHGNNKRSAVQDKIVKKTKIEPDQANDAQDILQRLNK